MLDFERLCRDKGIPFLLSGHHHCQQGWVQTHCPQCAGGREGYHLGYSLERGNFHCWRCGSLKVVDVLAGLLHIPRGEDVLGLIRQYQREYMPPRVVEKVERCRTVDPPEGCGPMCRVHRQYLRRRHFSPSQVEREWDVQGTRHLSGIWNWRIIIPIYDVMGRMVAYIGRSIQADVRPRYRMIESSQMAADPRTLLYGIHRARRGVVVVVEGPTGVWRLGPGAVATLSTNWHWEQVNALRKFSHRFILFDPEPRAQRKAQELADALAVFEGSTEILSGFDTDPGGFSGGLAASIRREIGL